MTVLVIEHDMNFVRALDCPVIVMLRGAVLRGGSYAEMQADPAVREAYLGQGGGGMLSVEGLIAGYPGGGPVLEGIDLHRRQRVRGVWVAMAWARPRCSAPSWGI